MQELEARGPGRQLPACLGCGGECASAIVSSGETLIILWLKRTSGGALINRINRGIVAGLLLHWCAMSGRHARSVTSVHAAVRFSLCCRAFGVKSQECPVEW